MEAILMDSEERPNAGELLLVLFWQLSPIPYAAA
jgi:hypothetical protein